MFTQNSRPTQRPVETTYERASQQLMPGMWQENPDLAARLTSDWKEDAIGTDPVRQISALLVILAQGGLAIQNGTSFGALEFLVVMRMICSLSGYFGLDYSPVSRLLRSNGSSLALLLLNIVGLFLGMQNVSMSLVMLYMVSLFDIWSATTQDTNPVRNMNQQRTTANERLWLTSWRQNGFVEEGSNMQTAQICFMAITFFLSMCAGAEG